MPLLESCRSLRHLARRVCSDRMLFSKQLHRASRDSSVEYVCAIRVIIATVAINALESRPTNELLASLGPPQCICSCDLCRHVQYRRQVAGEESATQKLHKSQYTPLSAEIGMHACEHGMHVSCKCLNIDSRLFFGFAYGTSIVIALCSIFRLMSAMFVRAILSTTCL